MSLRLKKLITWAVLMTRFNERAITMPKAKDIHNATQPWKIVYTHPFDTKQKAQKAEQIVKKWKSKKMIRLLIEDKIDIRDYLK